MKKKTVIVGITGGIAAYKIPKLIKLLQEDNIAIIPIMTYNACRIINPEEIEKVVKNKVYKYLFEKNFNYKEVLRMRCVDHVELADQADLAVVAPATANILGKLAHGIADDFLTTVLLATTSPILLCPSMNVHMWNNPVVRENVRRLKQYGYIILEPVSGMLACGYKGPGRLPDVAVIKEQIQALLDKNNLLQGKTILVTAGGTTEKIDEIRTITNRSSGKMGIAIAEASYRYGAKVILLRSKRSVIPRYQIEEYTFKTAEDLLSLLRRFSPKANICFHVAAVSDFTLQKQQGKIGGDQPLKLTLLPRQKLYKEIKKINPSIFLVTFKAEWQKSYKQLIKTAQKTLLQEKIDIVIVNDVGKPDRGFEADKNEVIIVKKDGTQKLLSLKSKRELAQEIIEATIL